MDFSSRLLVGDFVCLWITFLFFFSCPSVLLLDHLLDVLGESMTDFSGVLKSQYISEFVSFRNVCLFSCFLAVSP